MTRKTLVALLFVFILSACGSNFEAIPTSTLTPTLPATSTPQPTATFTLTPSPTVTPIPYTSGADDELQAKIITKAEVYMGMTLAEKFDEHKQNNADMGLGFNEATGYYISQQMFVGYEIISMNTIKGASPFDRALIGFMINDQNGELLYPYVLAYEHKGGFYRTSWAHFDKKTRSYNPNDGIWEYWQSINNFDKMVDHIENNAKVGELYWVDVQTFGGIPDKTPDEWLSLQDSDEGLGLLTTDAILGLIQLMDNDFIARMEGVNLKEVTSLLNTDAGDLGLFALSVFKPD